MEHEEYNSFLEERRILMANKIRKYYEFIFERNHKIEYSISTTTS